MSRTPKLRLSRNHAVCSILPAHVAAGVTAPVPTRRLTPRWQCLVYKSLSSVSTDADTAPHFERTAVLAGAPRSYVLERVNSFLRSGTSRELAWTSYTRRPESTVLVNPWCSEPYSASDPTRA